MLRTMLVTLMLAGMATVANGATVYKWVDARGQVHYTDLPPRDAGARLLATYHDWAGFDDPRLEDGSSVEALPPAAAEPEEEQESSSGDDVTAAAAVQRDVDAKRAEQCKQAQARYTQYIESQRLFRSTPDGKRQYLTDAELTQARIDAKKAVDDLCGTGAR